MADQDFQWFTMLDVEELGIDQIAKEAADRANDNVDAVYVSWDIDTFDPAYAPGTGEPEPNGLTSREGMRLMRLLSTSFDPDRFAFDTYVRNGGIALEKHWIDILLIISKCCEADKDIENCHI